MELKLHPQHAARMPYDKPPTAAATTSRNPPIQLPTVARAGAALSKAPLTPKLAARPLSTHANPTPSVVTPHPRRPARPESVLSSTTATPRDRDGAKSPIPAFVVANNITPRSGSRQSRVHSTNTTPGGTPNPDRNEHWDRPGLGISPAPMDEVLRRPMVAPAPDLDSKFFYASEAQKSPQPQPPAQGRPLSIHLQKPGTFLYANGGAVPQREATISPAHTPTLAPPLMQDNLMNKFVYANAIPDLQQQPSPKPSGSVVSTASRIPASRPASASPVPINALQRSLSPNKPSHSPAKHTISPVVKSPRSSFCGPSPSTAPLNHRRVNLEPPPRPTRPKHNHNNRNLTIVDPATIGRPKTIHASLPPSECNSPLNSAPPLSTFPTHTATTGFASLLQAAEDFAQEDDKEEDESQGEDKEDSSSGGSGSSSRRESGQGSTKSGSQEPPPLTDLVASARRERKVQDLQITNASLEAINRTLERQLRKQTAEIRRFKRLSRSGRLSINPVPARAVSGSSVEGGGLARAGMGLDDLSEEESELGAAELDNEEDEDELSSSEESGQLSPNTAAQRDERHRKRDEERLQLDLSKHQQLLVDSQKINQSLKRCLGWTEELIKEGKRALEYQVRFSDVEIVGGRVLAPEEVQAREAGLEDGVSMDEDGSEDDEDDLLTGGPGVVYELEDDTIDGPMTDEDDEDGDEDGPPWKKEVQDRDSGIEMPREGG